MPSQEATCCALGLLFIAAGIRFIKRNFVIPSLPFLKTNVITLPKDTLFNIRYIYIVLVVQTPPRKSGGIQKVSTRFSLSMEMSRLTRDGTPEPISRDQIFRREREQGSIDIPCSADHEQDWQPYPVDPYSCYM